MFFSVTGFYQFPTVTSGFQILFWTQNPPLATAYRFESGCRNHCPKSLVFQGFLAFFFPVSSAWGERSPYRFAAALSGDNRRSNPNILPQTGFLHKFFSVSFRFLSAGQSKIETQHTGRSQRVRGNGVPAVTVHRGLCQKRQTTDHHRPAV